MNFRNKRFMGVSFDLYLVILFVSVTCMITGVIMSAGLVSGQSAAREAVRSWIKAPAIVEDYKTRTKRGGGVETKVVYRYQVGSVSYRGSRNSFLGDIVSSREGGRYPNIGDEITIFINPDDPSDSVRDPEPLPEHLYKEDRNLYASLAVGGALGVLVALMGACKAWQRESAAGKLHRLPSA